MIVHHDQDRGLPPQLNLVRYGSTTMIPFTSILFAADFSERSRRASRVACARARPKEPRLYVLHVVEEPNVVEQSVAFGEAGISLLSESKPVAKPDRVALG